MNDKTEKKTVLQASQEPVPSLKRDDHDSTEEAKIDDRFQAVAQTSITGEGSPVILRTTMSLADYQDLIKKERADEQLAVPSQDAPQKTIEHDKDGNEIQRIVVKQTMIPALANPAALKHQDIIANEVTADGQDYLEIPVKHLQFVIDGQPVKLQKLKRYLSAGGSNLFKIDGNCIDLNAAQNFSGPITPIDLLVTTVNGDQHLVKYKTDVYRPVVVSADGDNQSAQLIFIAGDQQLSLTKAGVRQVFFVKDGENTTVINLTANGQTVAEAQIDPESGKITIISLGDYHGVLDKIGIILYLDKNQKIKIEYEPQLD